ncbi:formimidoylglutamate deiminase [Nocardioides caeni]|uniref:Formimidoylglutamate deiminase n=1 Tax=Nocardioides caeni TaxID=574700 RepID=A0A4S8NHJ3_9ACTN|nr:formimidoylglutamate deiminase [Nocardioides caeni]THV15885.1 formimidoylglutamate deiminase [Nocardioides caeni]
MTAWLLEKAWVDGVVRNTVRVEIEDGMFTSVEPDATRTATPLRGLTLPGFANTHSHAFHRALRGRTQRASGTFWTWREQMYDAAARLDPDSYFDLASATYAEMLAAGYTSVSEFHYVHHQPDGTPYDDPNALGHALVAAAETTGIRLTLLDTCYLAGGIGQPLSPAQCRFGDGDADRWAARVADIRHGDQTRMGGAIHSVRAVPRDQMSTVVAALQGRQLHAHVSEQPVENEACLAAYGLTPTALLAEEGALGPRATAVHATHLTDADMRLLAETDTEVSLCPTTERDLGDGIGPASALADAGVRLSIGSDSQAVIDPFEELRAWEMDERLASGERGRFAAADLLARTAGRIAVGEPGDLVTLDLASPRTAGTGADEHTAVFAATSADVTQVVAGGRVVFDGDHGRVGRALATAVERLWA